MKKKLTRPALAKDLYISTLFKGVYAYAQTFEPDAIFVLSAKYGLLPINKRIQPYELTLKSMSTDAVRQWASRVLTQIEKVADLQRDHFIILAGKDYRRFLVPHLHSYEIPLEGLDFGNQLKRLKELLAEAPPKAPKKARRPSQQPRTKQPKSSGAHDACERLHEMAGCLPRHSFPFDGATIPVNGIYLLFERGEKSHGGPRIVRVGTHTGVGQLPSRLGEHFLTPNKDRSIFRKNIGRALLNRDCDPFLASWEIDLTKKAARALYAESVDLEYQAGIEATVSDYIRKNFSFAVVEVKNKEQRLALESRLISTVSLCEKCRPSQDWLGLHAPNPKIGVSGLWQVQHLYKTPAGPADLALVERA